MAISLKCMSLDSGETGEPSGQSTERKYRHRWKFEGKWCFMMGSSVYTRFCPICVYMWDYIRFNLISWFDMIFKHGLHARFFFCCCCCQGNRLLSLNVGFFSVNRIRYCFYMSNTMYSMFFITLHGYQVLNVGHKILAHSQFLLSHLASHHSPWTWHHSPQIHLTAWPLWIYSQEHTHTHTSTFTVFCLSCLFFLSYFHIVPPGLVKPSVYLDLGCYFGFVANNLKSVLSASPSVLTVMFLFIPPLYQGSVKSYRTLSST